MACSSNLLRTMALKGLEAAFVSTRLEARGLVTRKSSVRSAVSETTDPLCCDNEDCQLLGNTVHV